MRGIVLAVVAVLAGCYDKPVVNCPFSCGQGGACPEGHACNASDGLCHRVENGGMLPCEVSLPDSQVTSDAPTTDAPSGDASSTDAPPNPADARPDATSSVDGPIITPDGPIVTPDGLLPPLDAVVSLDALATRQP